METQLHWWNGLSIILLNLVLAAVAWVRLQRGLPPTRGMRIAQVVAHVLITLQVLLGIGLLARGRVIPPEHIVVGLLALLALFLPLVVPTLRDRARSLAVVPTTVAVLAIIAFAIGEMR